MLKNFISDIREWGWHTALHNVLFMLTYYYAGAKHMHICYADEDCLGEECNCGRG